jgi:hypothetical protein
VDSGLIRAIVNSEFVVARKTAVGHTVMVSTIEKAREGYPRILTVTDRVAV